VIKAEPPKNETAKGPEDLTKNEDANSFITETLSNCWNIIMSGQCDDGSISPELCETLIYQFPKVSGYMRKELKVICDDIRPKVEITLIAIWLLQTRYFQREEEYSKLRFNAFNFLKKSLEWPSNVINHFLQAMTYAHGMAP